MRPLFLFMLFLYSPHALSDALPGPVRSVVIRTIDGDTLLVRARIWPGHEVTASVRLAGVDAPELRGRCDAESIAARRARSYLAKLIEGGPVELTDIKPDKYGGRVVARVTSAGRDLSELLILAGHARPYHGGKRGGWC